MSKVALVLAGGGLVGIAFEIGVLRAINQAWMNRTVNDLDLYVGTSAGSYVAAHLASGITIERMRHRMGSSETPLRNLSILGAFMPNVGEVVEKSLFLPITLLNAARATVRTRDPRRGMVRFLEGAIPSGLLDTAMLQRTLYRTLRREGYGTQFDDLPTDLHIIATDLDSGERTVFNRANPAPIEKAVAASCALPLVYRPVRINGRDYVDGGVRGTASIDLAVEEGADLIIVVNPLVPYQNEPSQAAIESDIPPGHLSDRGPVAITSQVSRAAIHAGLLYHIKQIKRAHPHVNVMLMEPPQDDPTLTFRNIMGYWQLNDVAAFGFRAGMAFWRRNEEVAREVLAQRDITLATRLQESAA